MNNVPAKIDAIESALVGGDLSKLTSDQKVVYNQRLCESLGLNPLTNPFQYLMLNGRLVLYATKCATDQLRKINGVSIQKLEKRSENGLYIVDAYAADKTGRTDVSTAAVVLHGLTGEKLANTIMKCETKAKRRVTLSICGLGWMDESEVDSVPDAVKVEPATVEEKQEPTQLPEPKEEVYFYDLKGVDPKRIAKAEELIEKAGGFQNDAGLWVCSQFIDALANRRVHQQEELV